MVHPRFSKSTVLFAMPSFTRGAAHALDLGSTLIICNESCSGEEADKRALLSDWKQVGIDISESMEMFGNV